MKLKIVLVRPLYEENVGLAARAAANFGCKELALVRPECDWKSGKARSRAMHGKQVLLKAKVFDSIREVVKGCSFVVATSAKQRRNRKAMDLEEIAGRFGRSLAKIALVFGPEPSGLSAAEIDECDFVARIPASGRYATLNLSHAVCVMLYCLFAAGKNKGKGKGFDCVKPATKRLVLKAFERDLAMLPGIDDKAMVFSAFKALLARALVSEKEARALTAFLSETGKGLGQKGKRKH